MSRVVIGLAAVSLFFVSMPRAVAAADVFDTSVASAQKALDQQRYKSAETLLKKALSKASEPDSPKVAAATTMLARTYRQSGRASEAADALAQAYAMYKKLGSADQLYADEHKAFYDTYRTVDVAVLGPSSSDPLKKNSAAISMVKNDSGAHVEIKMPAPYENQLNNAKVDGLQLMTLVSFDIEQPAPQDIRVHNIKGFKIHSVEKNTWANLLDLQIGALDAEGKYDAEITAGKAGFTKKVSSKLPVKAYEPVSGIAGQLVLFANPAPPLDLPVSTAIATDAKPVAPAAATTPTSSATATSTPTSAPTSTSTSSASSPPSASSLPAATPTTTSTAPAAPATTPQEPSAPSPSSSSASAEDSKPPKPEKSSNTSSIKERSEKHAKSSESRHKDDDDDDDDDDDKKEDDHLILHGVQKIINGVRGK